MAIMWIGTTTTMANGFMLFRFKTEPEMQAVMEKGPWLFGGKAIMLQKWHPSYKFDKDRISKLPVWIRLQGLPFPLWTQAGLSLAASMVGCPLSCDSQTYDCTRLEYDRLCVEIDASLPKVTHFEIVSPFSADPIAVEVEYEWLPPHCSQCKLYGHSCKNPNPQPTPNSTQLNPNTQPCPNNLHPPPPHSPKAPATNTINTSRSHVTNSLPKPNNPTTYTNKTNTTKLTHTLETQATGESNQPVPHQLKTCMDAQHPKEPNTRVQNMESLAHLKTGHYEADNFANPSTSKVSGKCTMSKMDSETHEASSASGTNFDDHNTSPPSSPKTARKKKGVKKKKAAQGC
ncbi:hypothetical protein OIU78_002863 [Salix suchowensis]|nr:hypothetical protein OIU78_002863 [Salix suchowensis]